MKFHRILPAAVTGLGLAFACIALPASAAPLKADPVKSTVSIVFKQLNVPVTAKFTRFKPLIDFDSTKPDATKASVEIDITSFDLGDPEYNQEVMKKDWFNAAQFPKATFTATAIKATTPGTFDATGILSIKGKTGNVHFPLTVKKEGAAQIFDGALPIKRLTYNIGEGDWKDTDTVADEVVIKFHIVTGP